MEVVALALALFFCRWFQGVLGGVDLVVVIDMFSCESGLAR
jgi:hypothetical protein